jgi:hypothetical protein
MPSSLPHLHLEIPPKLLLWFQRWNPFSHSLTWSRQSIRRFWKTCLIQFKRGRLHELDISGLVFHAAQELALFSAFASIFFSRLLIRLFARSVSRV